jgi:N-acetylneuraminic acid mutarotase
MRNNILILFLLFLIISCNNEKEFNFPLIQTGNVTNIDSSGATLHCRITDLSKENIIEYGFVWDSRPNPTIENAEKYVIRESPKTGVISQHISTTLRESFVYYVRAFMRNNNYITYGKEVAFTSLGSLAPQIIDFMPKTGNLKDTLVILGKNFSYRLYTNRVQFGEFSAIVIKANQDTLWVKVPDNLNVISSLISVTIQGNKTSSSDKFNLVPPVLDDFRTKIGTFGSQVTIYGNAFLANPASLHVYFDNFEAKIINIQNQDISITVPDNLNKRKCNIKVVMNNLAVLSADQFQLESLSINDFNPKIAVTGNTITLTGSNFSPVPENNIVMIGNVTGRVIASSINSLSVVLPKQDKSIYDNRVLLLSVEVLEDKKSFSDYLTIGDKWFRHKDSPINFSGSFYAVLNDKVYFGINNNKGFWEYNPVPDEFTKLTDFPGSARSGGNGFAINNKIYYGTGYNNSDNLKDFWEYDIASNSWIQKSNFYGNARTGSMTFSINENGYLGGGVYEQYTTNYDPFDDFWKYNSYADSWSRIPSFNHKEDSSSVYGMTNGISVAADDKAYIGLGWNYTASGGQNERWFMYNSVTNTWSQLTNFPKSRAYNNAIVFDLNGIPYVKTVVSDFYSFNNSTNSWDIIVTDLLPKNIPGIGFSIGKIGYVGIGNALWEFDPSR